METSTPHGRTLAADLCAEWAHDGVTYRHTGCPAAPLNGAVGTIVFRPPLPGGPSPRSLVADCDGCRATWHRFQSRWEKEPS